MRRFLLPALAAGLLATASVAWAQPDDQHKPAAHPPAAAEHHEPAANATRGDNAMRNGQTRNNAARGNATRENNATRRDNAATQRENNAARRDNVTTQRANNAARRGSMQTQRANNAARRANVATKRSNTAARRDYAAVRRFNANVRASRRFHINAYVRPSGWYARTWTYGQTLPTAWFAQQYWLTGWGGYGLMAPPDGYVWVREGDDALLIDPDSGYIVRVVYGVFY